MREVDFRYLRAALESLNSSTDLVLEFKDSSAARR